ncbi:MAG: 30S ribosomal protein S14 [Alphaproteobacteria bacterium]
MAKKSAIENNNAKKRLCEKLAKRRLSLKLAAADKTVSVDERFAASLRLAEMPRNSSKVRIRNRCALSGRPRGYYRKLGLSRIALRDLAAVGLIPGMTKSSW